MSRSYKKPYHGLCKTDYKDHKRSKTSMIRSTRRMLDNEKDVPSGAHFKKLIDGHWWRPDDGRIYKPEWAKAYRK